jgi:hypothetical protein
MKPVGGMLFTTGDAGDQRVVAKTWVKHLMI